MKRQLLLLSAVGALIATSCSKSEADQPKTNDGRIRVSSSIVGAQTKAIVGPTAALTGFKFIRADYATEQTNPEFVMGSGIYTSCTGDRAAGATSAVTFSGDQKYSQKNDYTYFLGYDPTAIEGGNAVIWDIDGKTDLLVTDVWSAGKFSDPKTTGMVFKHILSRIEVIVQAPDGVSASVINDNWGQIKSITVETPKEFMFDLDSRDLLPSGAETSYVAMTAGQSYATLLPASNIPAFGNMAVLCGAMIGLPVVTNPTNQVKLKITTDKVTDKEVTATLTTGNLTSGQIHTFTLTFDATTKNITVAGSTITDWVDGQDGTGSVTNP